MNGTSFAKWYVISNYNTNNYHLKCHHYTDNVFEINLFVCHCQLALAVELKGFFIPAVTDDSALYIK